MEHGSLATERDAVVQRLRDVGLRVTGPRLEVLQLLAAGDHLDVESITDRARARLGTLTSQAVYEMLRHFMETGLVRKFERPGRPAVFELAGTPHHHALCSQCGRVTNVAAETPEAPRKGLRGWRMTETELIFHGQCPDCR
ncbi:Putative transcriptional regulator FurA [Kitasatospora sp. MMS16-BH015]|uniref:Fur family transcriptional regulator n=1 Tax=Kitasatospora sp. MMS16-BH015 TaxID=2018025 RepID=UPI000CA3E47A|nr:Fur family transcriptional regulator [Kitasatospora sp. MMS16-BH015]AUG80701.1 Putative transcriptional regulator FurA [Kitasatospora sp. MMS16-BH015]